MTQEELKDKIRTLVKKVYQSKTEKKLDLDMPNFISLDSTKFPLLAKFPNLRDVIKDLLTPQY